MTTRKIAPYGAWQSPISAAMVASVGTGFGGLMTEIQVYRERVYWIEPRPAERGRHALLVRSPDGEISEALPADFNVRNRVHEYGGGNFYVHEGTIYFSNMDDQRLYRAQPGENPEPITPVPDTPAAWRFADGQVTPDGQLFICVRERHEANGEVMNELVAIPTSGQGLPKVIAEGRDFYANPRIHPSGRRIAWIAWDHPCMPWDGSELWQAILQPDGSLSEEECVAGGADESICNMEWSPEGTLFFLSDRTNWWNLYRYENESIKAVAPIEAELACPPWVMGYTRFTFLPEGRIVCAYWRDGLEHLGVIEPGFDEIHKLKTPFTAIPYLSSDRQGNLWFIGGHFGLAPSVIRMDPETGEMEIVYRNLRFDLDLDTISIPQHIAFPTEGGETAYALFFPPMNKRFIGPPNEKPPLLVMCHGGPTSAAEPYLQLMIQYWTSRGIAVADVNYRGSTGYGRLFRNRLRDGWGLVDAADCVHAAEHLAAAGQVSGDQLIIRGKSAGGWSVLCALTFYDTFRTGASYYGVADAKALADMTHKFEAHYLDTLIAPPEDNEIYRLRSPIFHTERLSCPLILFQGMQDKVVPPAQAEAMVEALDAKGIPYAYITFDDEGHGFRNAESIQRSFESELTFYARILGFETADPPAPIDVRNLEP